MWQGSYIKSSEEGRRSEELVEGLMGILLASNRSLPSEEIHTNSSTSYENDGDHLRVKVENLFAMCETCKKYGNYPIEI